MQKVHLFSSTKFCILVIDRHLIDDLLDYLGLVGYLLENNPIYGKEVEMAGLRGH